MIQGNAPVLVFPAKAGTHFSHGHRPLFRPCGANLPYGSEHYLFHLIYQVQIRLDFPFPTLRGHGKD
jgi:hypothetical protein